MTKWMRHYLITMAAALVLFVLAVTVVRPWSTALMCVMIVVAAVIPVVAVVLANQPGDEYVSEDESGEEYVSEEERGERP